jgi:PAS domain-containing protein
MKTIHAHYSETIESLKLEINRLNQRNLELETHKTQLELVIKSTGVGIWDWYVQTGETKFNERWANIIGYTLEELSPVSIETWIKYAHPDDLKESDRLLKEIWAGKTETVASLQGIGSKLPVFGGNPPSKPAFSVTLLQSRFIFVFADGQESHFSL